MSRSRFINTITNALRILIVDDHELVCGGISHLLSALPEVGTLDAVGTVSNAEKMLCSQQFDLILLDVKLPDGNGYDLLQKIKRDTPDVAVVCISGQMTSLLVRDLMESGADGLFDKSDPAEDLKGAVSAIRNGDFYASPSVVSLLNSPSRNLKLSPRQKEMLRYLSEGKTNKEIANQLDLSQVTVSFHLSELRRKLGCKSSREIVLKAEELGLSSDY